MSGERQQYDLFGGVPPHVDTDTSLRAAVGILHSAPELRARVLGAIVQSGQHGMTCDEVETALDMKHQTASARLRELALTSKIVDSKERRKTRSGRTAIVWRLPGSEQR